MSSQPSFRKEKPLQCFSLFTNGNWVLTKSLEGQKGVGSRLGLQKLFPEPDANKPYKGREPLALPSSRWHCSLNSRLKKLLPWNCPSASTKQWRLSPPNLSLDSHEALGHWRAPAERPDVPTSVLPASTARTAERQSLPHFCFPDLSTASGGWTPSHMGKLNGKGVWEMYFSFSS